MPDHVELVRKLWNAFEHGGIDAVLDIVDPDVEWEPYGGGGKIYRGHDGLRAYMQWRADRDEQTEAQLYTAFATGDFVVARGEVRIRGPQGMVTMQPGWLYEFRQGRLIRFRGFPTQDAALRAAGLAPRDAASIVRELWHAFNRGGISEMLELIHEDAEWHTYLGADPVYRGHEGIRRYYEEVAGANAETTAIDYSIRAVGDAVVVSGSLQIAEPTGAISQRQVHWTYWLRDDKIARAASFVHREQAVAAAESGEIPPKQD
jgi:ketosteroid isomerase-like protein